MKVIYVLFFLCLINPGYLYAIDINGRVVSNQTSKDVDTASLTNLELKKFYNSIQVSKNNNGLANSLVYIEKADGADQISSVKIYQTNKEFIPRIIPVVTGSEIVIINGDPIFHNVRAFVNGVTLFHENFPDLGSKTNYKITESGIISLKCEVHQNMQAYVVSLQNSFFAVTDNEGKYTIKNVPPGEYNLVSWHEILGTTSKKIKVLKNKDLFEVNFIYQHITSLYSRY